MLDRLTELLEFGFLTNIRLLRNSGAEWAAAVIVAVVTYLLLSVVAIRLVGQLKRFTARTKTSIDDIAVGVVTHTGRLFRLLVAVWAGAQALNLRRPVDDALDVGIGIVLILQSARWVNKAISLWLESTHAKRSAEHPGSATTIQGVSYLVRLIVWSAVILFSLDNLGFDVTALVAGLGIGGVAVALAVQNILGDLFASLSIALDKPFVIGDFVIVGEFMGNIEKVGLKTTRIRSLSGEQLIFSNSDLLSSRIRNLRRMKERRVALPLRVTFDTSAEQLEKLPQMIREIVEAIDQTRFDRSHLKEIGDSGYVFETIYWVLDPSYDVFMDVQQTLLLRLIRGLEEREISVAYPTRTVWLGADWQEVDEEQQPSAA